MGSRENLKSVDIIGVTSCNTGITATAVLFPRSKGKAFQEENWFIPGIRTRRMIATERESALGFWAAVLNLLCPAVCPGRMSGITACMQFRYLPLGGADP